jgi:uncharacterized Zn-finger protein
MVRAVGASASAAASVRHPGRATTKRCRKGGIMADKIVPHFHNDPGVASISIGAKRFMCIGATPPFDHPHVFLDMGDDTEIVCPYCSTLYRHDPALHGFEASPPECALRETKAA